MGHGLCCGAKGVQYVATDKVGSTVGCPERLPAIGLSPSYGSAHQLSSAAGRLHPRLTLASREGRGGGGQAAVRGAVLLRGSVLRRAQGKGTCKGEDACLASQLLCFRLQGSTSSDVVEHW